MKTILLLAAAACSLAAQSNPTCNGHNPIVITTSGSTVIIPARAGQNIHVCVVDFSLAAGTNIKFLSVGSGAADMSGVYANVLTMTKDFGGQPVGLGLGFGINLATATTGGGTASYYVTNGY